MPQPPSPFSELSPLPGAPSSSQNAPSTGIRDWDYVTIGDYKKDMSELSQDAAAIIEMLTKERDEMKHMLAFVLGEVGKPVAIPRFVMARRCPPDIIVSSDEANNAVVLEAQYATDQKRNASSERYLVDHEIAGSIPLPS